jgi:Protein of unknown function (DUF3684)
MRSLIDAKPATTKDVIIRRVEVNQRALIDKILARYATANAIYRELIQNSNDASATIAEIHISTSDTSQMVTHVMYRNNGTPFQTEDWNRLIKIAEGNPNPNKIGAFGVGAYTIFSISEEPIVLSNQQCLIFAWDQDALFTKQITVKEDQGEWTTFLLPSRDPYPLTDLLEMGQFLLSTLTFTNSLHTIRLFVNEVPHLTITKSIVQPPVSLPLSSSKNVVSSVTQSAASLLFHYSSGGSARKSRTTDTWMTNDHLQQCTLKTTLFHIKEVQESIVRFSVSVLEKNTAVTTSTTHVIDAKYISAIVSTQIPTNMVTRMERVTKKLPPTTLPIQLFFSHDSDATTPARTTATKIAKSILPHSGTGRVFIGFRTSQTTGFGVHVAAPFIPTVEREAMDVQDPTLKQYNLELLHCSGILLRYILEHTMYRTVHVLYQANAELRKRLDEQCLQEWLSQKAKKTSQAVKTTHSGSRDLSEDSEDAASSKSFMGLARYMARGVTKQIVHVAKSVGDLMMDPSGSAEDQALFHPPDPRPLSSEEIQAVTLMSSFCPQPSTPDPLIGTTLAQGFSLCLPNHITPPVLTQSGVFPGNEARLPHFGMEGFVTDKVIRSMVYQQSQEYHTVVAQCRSLNFDDLLAVLSKTVLEPSRLAQFLKWWTRFCTVEQESRSSVQRRGHQLKEILRYYGDDVAPATADNRKIFPLSQHLFFLESHSPFHQRDIIPLPETVLPKFLQKAIGIHVLTQDAMLDVWFSPFPMEIFVEFISRHDCMNTAQPEQELLRIQVLNVLCREFMRRAGAERTVWGGLCHSLLSTRRCIPFDSEIPTSYAADYPTDLYLYSAELQAFQGIGSFHKVAHVLQSADVTEVFLVALGVRKSVSIDFLFSHLDTLRWSQNPKALIEYLQSATLTPQDMQKLATTKYLPATNDPSTNYAPSELYLPNEALSIFPFVKTLAWSESTVSEHSTTGAFLRRLGMGVLPPLAQILSFLAKDDLSDEQRFEVFDFICDRLVPHGVYYSQYNALTQSDKSKYRIIPCIARDPVQQDLSVIRRRESPVTCYADAGCAVLGFPVMDPHLGKKGALYASLLQCDAEPPANLLLNQFKHLVARAKSVDSSKNPQYIVSSFQDIFKYLSQRSSDFKYASLEALASDAFIPSSKADKLVWYRPNEVFFRRSTKASDSLTEDLFHVIDFNPFLAATGVKEEATTADLFLKILNAPQDVLRILGCEKKYRALLRRIAADPPFHTSRPPLNVKTAPFLLAYQVPPYSDVSPTSTDDRMVHHLAKAEDIYVIDNSNYGRMFKVNRAPPESDLEDFYIRLGSQYISKSVERRFEVVGIPKTSTATITALRDRLRERSPLLVSPNITSRPLVSGAASIVDDKRLEFYEVANLMVVYSLGKVSRRTTTTCFSKPSGSKNAIYITPNFDLFDVGQAIGDLILKRCMLEDAFFISSLLETPLEQLRARGFPVDRIIKSEPELIPEEAKPSSPSIVSISEAKKVDTSNGGFGSSPTVSSNSPMTLSNRALSGDPKLTGAKTPAQPANSFTGTKADILMQMFPDADQAFVHAALGKNPSVDDVKELANTMANGHYPKGNPSDDATVADSTDDGDLSVVASLHDAMNDFDSPKKKSLRQRLGRAFGGKRGSSVFGGTVPHVPPLGLSQGSEGGNVNSNGVQHELTAVKPSFSGGASHTHEYRAPVSAAEDASTQIQLEKMLERSVNSSNRVTRSDIDSPETSLTSIPADLDRGETCEVIPGHSLQPFFPLGGGAVLKEILVFSSKEHGSSQTFLMENLSSLKSFAEVLERLCVGVFNLKLSSIAIYHDPAGLSIAFNRNKALHFNIRFFHGLHYLRGKVDTCECYAYWFVTFCHELAHHLVSGHTKEHGFYCENFNQMYMPKLIAMLRDHNVS